MGATPPTRLIEYAKSFYDFKDDESRKENNLFLNPILGYMTKTGHNFDGVPRRLPPMGSKTHLFIRGLIVSTGDGSGPRFT